MCTHPIDSVVKNVLCTSNVNSCTNSPWFVIKCKDVEGIIPSMKPFKSPGPDGIPNVLLKKLPKLLNK